MRDHRRLVVTGRLTALQPITVGGDRHDPEVGNRMLVAKNQDGVPLIPGTSLAGVLRRRLVEVVGATSATVLFGPDVDADELRASPLVVDDALMRQLCDAEANESSTSSSNAPLLPLLARTAIDRDRGSAAAGLLFETEYVPVDSVFGFRVHLIDPTDTTTSLLTVLLQSIEDEPISVGGATRSGRGELAISGLTVRDLDLTDGSTLRQFLLAGVDERDLLGRKVDLVDDSNAGGRVSAEPRVRVTCTFRLVQPLLGGRVDRGVSDEQGHANVTEHRELTASSIRGALRSRAERIQRTMHPSVTTWDAAIDQTRTGTDPEEADLVSKLFGSSAGAGHIHFRKVVHEGADPQEFTSIAVDRWTGGTVESHLFVNKVAVGGDLQFAVDVAATDHRLTGLLFLALLDLSDGDLPLGSSTRRGMGEMELKEIRIESRGSVKGLSSSTDASSRSWSDHKGWTREANNPVTRASIVDALPEVPRTFVVNSVRALTTHWEVTT